MDQRRRSRGGSVRSARRKSQQADEQAAAGYVHSPSHIPLTHERVRRLPPFPATNANGQRASAGHALMAARCVWVSFAVTASRCSVMA